MSAVADPKTSLILAIPSKGRLRELSFDFLRSCGLPLQLGGNEREYTGSLKGLPGTCVQLLRADEIPQRLEDGEAHLGITGQDLFRELTDSRHRQSHILIDELGYGHARLVVAVPRSWIDVGSIEDLEEIALATRQLHGRALRVATKFTRLTREFFDQHGIADYRIVESLGATEAAPAAGTADIVVDLTSTGATLVQNHLKVIDGGTIVDSQACLLTSMATPWPAAVRATLRQALDIMEARLRAQQRYILHFSATRALIEQLQADLHKVSPLFLKLLHSDADTAAEAAYTSHCEAAEFYPIVRELRAIGCREITAQRVDYMFTDTIDSYQRFCYLLEKFAS